MAGEETETRHIPVGVFWPGQLHLVPDALVARALGFLSELPSDEVISQLAASATNEVLHGVKCPVPMEYAVRVRFDTGGCGRIEGFSSRPVEAVTAGDIVRMALAHPNSSVGDLRVYEWAKQLSPGTVIEPRPWE